MSPEICNCGHIKQIRQTGDSDSYCLSSQCICWNYLEEAVSSISASGVAATSAISGISIVVLSASGGLSS
jgi:hypothetical protein